MRIAINLSHRRLFLPKYFFFRLLSIRCSVFGRRSILGWFRPRMARRRALRMERSVDHTATISYNVPIFSNNLLIRLLTRIRFSKRNRFLVNLLICLSRQDRITRRNRFLYKLCQFFVKAKSNFEKKKQKRSRPKPYVHMLESLNSPVQFTCL